MTATKSGIQMKRPADLRKGDRATINGFTSVITDTRKSCRRTGFYKVKLADSRSPAGVIEVELPARVRVQVTVD